MDKLHLQSRLYVHCNAVDRRKSSWTFQSVRGVVLKRWIVSRWSKIVSSSSSRKENTSPIFLVGWLKLFPCRRFTCSFASIIPCPPHTSRNRPLLRLTVRWKDHAIGMSQFTWMDEMTWTVLLATIHNTLGLLLTGDKRCLSIARHQHASE